jgi:ABC-2 type transport system permease protein
LAKLSTNSSGYLFIILSGLIFWIIVWRAQYEINTNILAEIWDKNIVNIFVTPLNIYEWILSFMIFGFLKSLISVIFSALIAYLLYGFNLFFVSLMLTGWAFGFLVAGFVIRFGERIQTLAWGGIAIIVPFSALYYPLSILPHWAQIVAHFIPSSYVFEALREMLFTKQLAFDKLGISFGINILYLILGIAFFVFMFNKAKKLGIGRLI